MSKDTPKHGKVVRRSLVEICVAPLDYGGRCFLRFDDAMGFVSIASDYGNWTYHWPPHHRPDSLGRFLWRINMDYAGVKFLGPGYTEPDNSATESGVKRHVLELRKSRDLDSETARDEFDLASCISIDGIDLWLRETSIDDAFYLVTNRVNRHWKAFWKKAWAPLIRPVLEEWPYDKAEAADYEARLDAVGKG